MAFNESFKDIIRRTSPIREIVFDGPGNERIVPIFKGGGKKDLIHSGSTYTLEETTEKRHTMDVLQDLPWEPRGPHAGVNGCDDFHIPLTSCPLPRR